MFKSRSCRYALVWVKFKHFLEQVQSFIRNARRKFLQGLFLPPWEARLEVRQVGNIGPILCRRSSHDLKNLENLFYLVTTA